jgi:hypothetical protein
MPDRAAYELVGEALAAAERVLRGSGRTIDGVLLVTELDGEGALVAASDDVENISTLLAEASWRAAGAGA